MVSPPRSISWPYYALDPAPAGSGERWAIFFGADFYNMTEIDVSSFITKTNQCLEYLRKNCPDCKLIYRPHPDEKEELKVLNLRDFAIQRDGQTAEEFLWFNKNNIQSAFSVCSTSSIAGLNIGLNAYAFYKYFTGVFHGAHKIFVDKYFAGMPDSFFVKDLTSPLINNRVTPRPDSNFIEKFREILSSNSGPLWFIVVENRFLLAISALAKMAKQNFPNRPINLVISRHHRWQDEALATLQADFDQVLIFPRHFYSLQPSKLFSAWRTARRIKKLRIEPSSIFLGFAHHSFIENCFISYHPKPYKLAFLPEKTWEITFHPVQAGFDVAQLRPTGIGWFYSHLLEPLLGLQHTKFQQYSSPKPLAFIRLEHPLEELYDQVLLFKNWAGQGD